MNTKKHALDRKLSELDPIFQSIADRFDLQFEEHAGPGLGRALRAKSGLERGIFLELKQHWMEATLEALDITLTYCAWVRVNPAGHPFYFFSKLVYDASFDAFVPQAEELLKNAAEALCNVDEEYVRSHGQFLQLPIT